MPRADDRAFPTIGGDRPDIEPWPARLRIGIARQPVPVYVYDDHSATYDDPEGDYTYDDTTGWPFDRFDLFCRFHGVRIVSGGIDDLGAAVAGHVEMTLDNRDGYLSQYNAAGQLVDWTPGSALDIWAELAGQKWWLFSGTITAWRERADGTIDAEAFDAFTDLNETAGAEWVPGIRGEPPATRLNRIVTKIDWPGHTRFDVGNVTLHAFATEATPLEEMQAVAASDGGMVFVDADGALVYRSRAWPAGRADQTARPQFTDNYCSNPDLLQVWDAEMTTDDDHLVNAATLSNVADLTVEFTDVASIDQHHGKRAAIEHTDDQWIARDHGMELAQWIVARHRDTYLRLERFHVYVNDVRQDYWGPMIDLRIGDVVEWIHEQSSTTGAGLIWLDLVVGEIDHDITPELWTTTIRTTSAVGAHYLNRYDVTDYTYDDADPLAVYA